MGNVTALGELEVGDVGRKGRMEAEGEDLGGMEVGEAGGQADRPPRTDVRPKQGNAVKLCVPHGSVLAP